MPAPPPRGRQLTAFETTGHRVTAKGRQSASVGALAQEGDWSLVLPQPVQGLNPPPWANPDSPAPTRPRWQQPSAMTTRPNPCCPAPTAPATKPVRCRWACRHPTCRGTGPGWPVARTGGSGSVRARPPSAHPSPHRRAGPTIRLDGSPKPRGRWTQPTPPGPTTCCAASRTRLPPARPVRLPACRPVARATAGNRPAPASPPVAPAAGEWQAAACPHAMRPPPRTG